MHIKILVDNVFGLENYSDEPFLCRIYYYRCIMSLRLNRIVTAMDERRAFVVSIVV